MSRHVIVRIADETEIDDTRSKARVIDVIHGGFNSRGEVEQGLEDMIHQGDSRDVLIVRSSPNLGTDPAIGSWLTLHHR